MSIIEKAAGKLASQRPAPAPRPDPGDLAEATAAAGSAPRTGRVGALGASDGGPPEVVVDRSALRAAGFLAPEDYERQLAEEYRRIKRPILANAFGGGAAVVPRGNLVMIASALSGEGKTHTCINLALSIAMEKERTVLLVDGDVAKPTISRVFGVEDHAGLLDVLEGEATGLDAALVRTDIPRLRLLPAGRPRPSATELLNSDRMGALCDELSARYPDRVVIFDSSPLLTTSESLAVAGSVGQVVLVVAAGITPRRAVRDALQQLDAEQPVNVVLNKDRRGGGGGYYGYYGGYGEREDADAPAA